MGLLTPVGKVSCSVETAVESSSGVAPKATLPAAPLRFAAQWVAICAFAGVWRTARFSAWLGPTYRREK